MPLAKLKIAVRQARGIAAIVGENEKIRATYVIGDEKQKQLDIDEHYWRTYDYCAAVVRLYGGLERFIFDVIADWVKFLAQHDPERLFLSSKAVDRYKYGASEILKRSSEPRFENVDLALLSEGLMYFVQGKPSNRLAIEAFFAALPNLRFADLQGLLAAVEIEDAGTWFANYRPLVELCEAENITVESQLKDLVERRNEAAHGNELPTDTLATNALGQLAEFVAMLCSALAELITHNISLYAIAERKNFAKIGDVINVFAQPKACLLRSGGNPISMGSPMLIKSGTRCFISRVIDIRLEGDSYLCVNPNPDDSIGLKFDILPIKAAEIYRLDLLPLMASVSY
jgi:hypothetical protein